MSTSIRHPRRLGKRGRWRMVAVAACLLLVTACSGGRDVPDAYGATTERNFTEGCVASLTVDEGEGPAYDSEAADDVCGCAYDEITSASGIPYERFQDINDAQEEEPAELPAELREVIDRCRPTTDDPSPDS